MPQIRFRLYISPEQFLAHYSGTADQVLVTSENGERVRFPSSVLQPYVTHQGISGRFEITFDQNGRFTSLKRLNDKG